MLMSKSKLGYGKSIIAYVSPIAKMKTFKKPKQYSTQAVFASNTHGHTYPYSDKIQFSDTHSCSIDCKALQAST